jgi:hypothetical protein
LYIAGKVEGIVDLNSIDLNSLGITAVVKVFKALYKGLGKLMYLTNVSLNHLLLGSE